MFSVQSLTNYLSHEYVNNNVVTSPKDILFSLALQICEIILWLNNFIKSHNDNVENKKMCKTIGVVEKVEGNESICVIKSNGPGRESCICISADYVTSKDLIGKKVVVIEEKKNNDTATKDVYPYFASKIQSLEKEKGSK